MDLTLGGDGTVRALTHFRTLAGFPAGLVQFALTAGSANAYDSGRNGTRNFLVEGRAQFLRCRGIPLGLEQA
jgi:hypothetical protein